MKKIIFLMIFAMLLIPLMATEVDIVENQQAPPLLRQSDIPAEMPETQAENYQFTLTSGTPLEYSEGIDLYNPVHDKKGKRHTDIYYLLL